MNPVATFSSTWKQAPAPVRLFLSRALIIFVVWKLLYHLFLYPIGFPDKLLTNLTGVSTSFLYRNLMNEPVIFFRDELRSGVKMAVVYIQNKRVIGVADGCNGLELYVLFIAFLFCIPTNIKRQIAFTLIGTAVIFISNGFRCFALAWLFLHNYSWANFAHHYLFKMVIYSMIFYMWIVYVKKKNWHEN